MKTFRVLHSGKFQASGFARCEQCITAYLLTFSVITYRFQFTRLISYLIESEKKMIRTFSHTQGFSIQQQFHLLAIRYDIYRFHRIFGIIPMSDNIGLILIRIYPTVPHYLMGKESIFLYAHGICYATTTIIFFTAIVCIGI